MSHPSPALLLIAGQTHWGLYASTMLEEPLWKSQGEEVSTDSLEELSSLLTKSEHSRWPIVVALESNECLTSSFEVASPKQTRQHATLCYQLEEFLPIGAEEVVACFSVEGTEVFGVSCQKSWLTQILKILAEAGSDLRCVAPLTLQATVELVDSKELSGFNRIVWLRSETYEQLLCCNGLVKEWRSHSLTSEAVRTNHALESLNNRVDCPVVIVGQKTVAQQLGMQGGVLEDSSLGKQEVLLSYAARRAERIIQGGVTPVMNFLDSLDQDEHHFKNPLAKEWSRLRFASLLFLASLLAWQFSQGYWHTQTIDQLQTDQTDVFRELYPEKRVPQGILLRLQSEQKRILGTRSKDASTPIHQDVILLFQQVLDSLPKEMRFRLLEMRIESAKLYLVGEVRSHGDADRLAASLRKIGLEVSPPSTQQLAEKGVEFRLSAEKHTEELKL